MKKHRLLGVFLLFVSFALPILANEECDEQLQYAKKLYNAGKYQDAKENFDYVQKICGPTYGAVDQWIIKCNEALNPAPKKTSQSSSSSSSASSSSSRQTSQPTLTVSETYIYAPAGGLTKYLTVTSNRSWEIQYPSGNMYSVTSSGSGITVTIKANTTSQTRTDYFNVRTVDGTKTVKIDLSQAAGSSSGSSSGSSTSSSSSSSNSTSAYLTLSKTYITASASGTTEYITVSSNRAWEIQYPSASMYTVTKLSNTSIKVVINKNTGGSRQDFFNIKTTDGSKTVKVSLSQGQGNGGYSSSSNYSNSSYRTSSSSNSRSSSGYTALKSFNRRCGKWEVDWLSLRTAIGTGYEIEGNMFGVRYSCIRIDPLNFGLGIDFLNNTRIYWYYQPEFKFVFPWNDYCAIELGAGPSLQFPIDGGSGYYYGRNVWFAAEFGIRHNWGYTGSSNYFLRYDGTFVFGIAINLSTSY